MSQKIIALIACLLLAAVASRAQAVPPAQTASPDTINAQAPAATVSLTLADALARAKANSPQFQAALTQLGLAREDRVQARAALLPGVDYNNGFIYTEGNGTAVRALHRQQRSARVHQPGRGAASGWLGASRRLPARCRGASAGPSQSRDRRPRIDRHRGAGILRIAGCAGQDAEHAGGRRRGAALPRQQPQTGAGRRSRALRRDQGADPGQRSAARLAGCEA